MSNKAKEILVKFSIVIAGVLLVFSVITFPIICTILGYEFEEIEKTWLILLLITLVSGIIMMFLMAFLKFSVKSVKAEKMPLYYNCYHELVQILQQILIEKAYLKQDLLTISTIGEVIVYIKSSKPWELDCFTIIRVPELSDEILEVANDKITVIITEYYSGRKITDTINMISVFCVDRITPTFQRLVNSNLQQGLKNGRLNVGISFGGKKIYIAQQKDGFAIARYKRLRKEFFDIVKILESKKLNDTINIMR